MVRIEKVSESMDYVMPRGGRGSARSVYTTITACMHFLTNQINPSAMEQCRTLAPWPTFSSAITIRQG